MTLTFGPTTVTRAPVSGIGTTARSCGITSTTRSPPPVCSATWTSPSNASNFTFVTTPLAIAQRFFTSRRCGW